jgi:hypothetical protein
LDDAEALKKLRALHPQSPLPQPLPTPPTTVLAITEDEVLDTLRRSRRGKAPGPSGWTEELLLIACDSPVARRNLVALVADIANGNISRDAAAALRRCRLVGIPKKDGGIRPIAVGEVLVRIAGSIALSRALASLLQKFGDHQRGMRPGGAESIAHDMRLLLGDEEGLAVATIDCRNAFNTVSREAVRQAILEGGDELNCLRPLFNTLYCEPSSLVSRHGEVTSSSGVRQGDVLGPAFFCLAIDAVIRRASAKYPTVAVVGYLDDITIAGRGEALSQCAAFIRAELLLVGLSVNSDKCYLCMPRAASPEEAAELVAQTGFKLSSTIRVLGAWIGETNAASSTLLELAQAQTVLCDRLQQLDPDEALALLRLCVLPRWTFFARVHPPAVCMPACHKFDDRIWAELCRLAQVDAQWAAAPPQYARRLASLPTAMGGLGLTRMTEIAAAAYDASRLSNGDSQDVRTKAIFLAIAAELDKDAGAATRRAALSKSQATRFLLPPTVDSPRWSSAPLFAHALQLRLGLAHSAPETTGFKCPCSYIGPAALFGDHMAGCAVREGFNATRRAALLNDAVANFLHARAPWIAVEKQPMAAPSTSPTSPSRFADLLVSLPQGNLVVDWVIFSPCAVSGPTAATSEKRKNTTYGGLHVAPAAISIFGGMTSTTLRCLRAMEVAAGVEKNSLVDVVVRTVVKGTASCIQSACIRSGRCSSSKPNSNNNNITMGVPITALPVLDEDDEKSSFELGVSPPPTSSPTPSSPSHVSTLPASVSQATPQNTNLAAQETIVEGNVLYVNVDGNVHSELGKEKSTGKNGGPTETIKVWA